MKDRKSGVHDLWTRGLDRNRLFDTRGLPFCAHDLLRRCEQPAGRLSPMAKPLDGVHNGGRIGEVRFAKLLGPFEVGVQHAQDTREGRERLHAGVP